MPTTSDLLYVALFAVAGPLIDYAVVWPAHRRVHGADPARARRWLWGWTIGSLWLFVAIGVALWIASGRSFAMLGLTLPSGWRLWAAVVFLLLVVAYQAWAIGTVARNAEHRAALRVQMASLDTMVPHRRAELRWFGGVSVTAGFCEEFLYRGYFVWAFAPWLGWWGAAALSIPFFALAHFYQGWSGVLRTAAVGALFTGVVALFDSLWPAVVLHASIDFGSGAIAWLVLRELPSRAREGG